MLYFIFSFALFGRFRLFLCFLFTFIFRQLLHEIQYNAYRLYLYTAIWLLLLGWSPFKIKNHKKKKINNNGSRSATRKIYYSLLWLAFSREYETKFTCVGLFIISCMYVCWLLVLSFIKCVGLCCAVLNSYFWLFVVCVLLAVVCYHYKRINYYKTIIALYYNHTYINIYICMYIKITNSSWGRTKNKLYRKATTTGILKLTLLILRWQDYTSIHRDIVKYDASNDALFWQHFSPAEIFIILKYY